MRSRSAALACASGLCLALSACATTPGNQRVAQADPLEPVNRGIYAFNDGVDTVVLTPATKVYRAVVPTAAQRGATNAFNNVDEPLSFVNALLQGKPKVAANALGRFMVNTVLGVGGLADHATDMGLIRQEEDFGQTLAVWGVNSGPFIVLPLFGPSTFRDGVGLGAEFLGDPYRLALNEANLSNAAEWGLTGLELLDTRSQLMSTADVLLLGSADEYATVRAAYLQLRESEIYDGAPPEEVEELPAAAAGSTPAPLPQDPPAPAAPEPAPSQG
jgi:phospholipid-binding lipoprotein MlaA